jgi:hypothetical protein
VALIPNVSPNELIESAWGNTIRDHVVQTFATVAERDTWTGAPNGAVAMTLDSGTLWKRVGGAWLGVPSGTIAYGDTTAAYESGDIGTTAVSVLVTPSVTLHAGRKYRASAGLGVIARTGTTNLAGTQEFTAPAGFPTINRDVPLPGANIAVSGAVAIEFLQPSTSTGVFTLKLSQAWYAGAPVRFIIAAGYPAFLNVTDIGS